MRLRPRATCNPRLAITRFIVAGRGGAEPRLPAYRYSVGHHQRRQAVLLALHPVHRRAEELPATRSARSSIEVGVGERVLLLLLAFAVGLSAIFLLAPFVVIRKTWKLLPRKPLSALYFIAIGLGFIFFEITMIQKMVLFLGFPTYSLTVTLSSLLIFVGIGVVAQRGSSQPRGAATHRAWASCVALLTAFYLFGLTPTDGRAAAAGRSGAGSRSRSCLMAPLGLALGVFMPLGVRAVASLSEHTREYVAWGWALNGFASVVGSILATILAMTYGFHVVLVVAFCGYLVAFAALHGLSRRTAGASA